MTNIKALSECAAQSLDGRRQKRSSGAGLQQHGMMATLKNTALVLYYMGEISLRGVSLASCANSPRMTPRADAKGEERFYPIFVENWEKNLEIMVICNYGWFAGMNTPTLEKLCKSD